MRTLFLLLQVLAGPALAQEASPTPELPQVLRELRAVAQQIEATEAAANEGGAQALGVPLEALRERLAGLRELQEVLQRQETALRQLQALEDPGTAEVPELEEEPPYSMELFDRLRDRLARERQALETAQLEREGQERGLKAAEKAEERAEQAYREARDASLPAWQVEAAGLRRRIAREEATHRRLQLRLSREEAERAARRVALLERQVEEVGGNVRFTTEDLQEKRAELARQAQAARDRLQRARIRQQADEARLAEARDRLAAGRGEEEIAARTRALEARSEQAQTSRLRVELLEERLGYLEQAQELWSRRFALTRKAADRSLLPEWEHQTRQLLEEAARSRQVQEARLQDLLPQTVALRGRVEAGEETLRDRLEALEEREDLLQEHVALLVSVEELARRLSAAIAQERQAVTWGERWEDFQQGFLSFWRYQIFSVGEDTVTVSKVVGALVILVLGVWLSRRAVGALRRRALAPLGVEEHVAAALEKLSYYFLILMTVLFALHTVNIPLTLFTFLGGGAAIAIGFGAQNLLNNFLSGLILMLERPVRIGDMIEMDQEIGVIEEIGARCTRLRTFTGIHILIPNSKLLENSVINWTLSDDKVRTHVKVGVAYGSPTEEVRRILMQVVHEHPGIDSYPEPTVLFAEFGDSALNFEVHFWLSMRSIMERRRIESDVRYRADQLLREAGITIAFPQRDVHLDAPRPLEVRLVGGEKG